MDLGCSSETYYLRPVEKHRPVARQHRPQFTLDQSFFMVVSYCNTNAAQTMAFMIMAKVAHFVFTTHRSKDHNFTPDHGMIPFKNLLTQHTGKLCFWPLECCCCALFTFSAIKRKVKIV